VPLIFVNTDNSDSKNKIYNGVKAGGAKAEEKMQKAVIRIIDKTDGFTTAKSDKPKGYSILLTVSKVDVGEHDSKCSLEGAVAEFPSGKIISARFTGSGRVTGTSERDIIDCVEAVAEDMILKSIKAMRDDFASRP